MTTTDQAPQNKICGTLGFDTRKIGVILPKSCQRDGAEVSGARAAAMLSAGMHLGLGAAAASFCTGLLGGSALQLGHLPTIGSLGGISPAQASELSAPFLRRLRELGWIEGRNIAIEYFQ